MTRFKEVALPHAGRLINHGPTVLVISAHRTVRNVMAAAWSMPVEFTPPRIAIVIDKRPTRANSSWPAAGSTYEFPALRWPA